MEEKVSHLPYVICIFKFHLLPWPPTCPPGITMLTQVFGFPFSRLQLPFSVPSIIFISCMCMQSTTSRYFQLHLQSYQFCFSRSKVFLNPLLNSDCRYKENIPSNPIILNLCWALTKFTDGFNQQHILNPTRYRYCARSWDLKTATVYSPMEFYSLKIRKLQTLLENCIIIKKCA